MTKHQANSNIGQPFKPMITGTRFDTIRKVDPDGTIHGDFTESNCNDCRLKQEQPLHLKKSKHNEKKHN